jgi:hypothetical protein
LTGLGSDGGDGIGIIVITHNNVLVTTAGSQGVAACKIGVRDTRAVISDGEKTFMDRRGLRNRIFGLDLHNGGGRGGELSGLEMFLFLLHMTFERWNGWEKVFGD